MMNINERKYKISEIKVFLVFESIFSELSKRELTR